MDITIYTSWLNCFDLPTSLPPSSLPHTSSSTSAHSTTPTSSHTAQRWIFIVRSNGVLRTFFHAYTAPCTYIVIYIRISISLQADGPFNGTDVYTYLALYTIIFFYPRHLCNLPSDRDNTLWSFKSELIKSQRKYRYTNCIISPWKRYVKSTDDRDVV